MPEPDEIAVCPTLFNVQMEVHPKWSNVVESSVYYYGVYEAGTLHALHSLLAEGGVFLDVGANIGFLSCSVARLLGDRVIVFAIEPHPETFEILNRNIRINGLRNVRSLDIAVGSVNSEERIYDHPQGDRGSATLIPPSRVHPSDGTVVKVRTMDTLIGEKAIAVPDVVKIDVEGFELEVLRGAETLLSGSKAPALCVEYSVNHPPIGGRTLDVFRLLKSVNDYRIFRLAHTKAVPSKLIEIRDEGELPDYDNIFSLLDRHIKT